jgi:uncharacterized alkaline shock family protein YloU
VAAASTPPGLSLPAGGRGATHIADRVVAKIAAQAAYEALHEGPEAHTVPHGRRTVPHAAVSVRSGSARTGRPGEARIRIALELGYPSDIGAQCGAVRRQVALRVRELAGMEVPGVAVEVERLHSEQLDGDGPGRVQ